MEETQQKWALQNNIKILVEELLDVSIHPRRRLHIITFGEFTETHEVR